MALTGPRRPGSWGAWVGSAHRRYRRDLARLKRAAVQAHHLLPSWNRSAVPKLRPAERRDPVGDASELPAGVRTVTPGVDQPARGGHEDYTAGRRTNSGQSHPSYSVRSRIAQLALLSGTVPHWVKVPGPPCVLQSSPRFCTLGTASGIYGKRYASVPMFPRRRRCRAGRSNTPSHVKT